MGRFTKASVLALALGLAACTTGEPEGAAPQTPSATTAAPPPATPGPTDGNAMPGAAAAPGPTASGEPVPHDGGFAVREAATLSNPWAMEFIPGADQLLITQQTGELILRDQRTGENITVEGTPEVVYEGQGGLGDIIVAPTFEQDQTIYLSWVEAGDGGTGAVVGRAQLESTGGTARINDLNVIWRQEPKASGDSHFAHRMTFSPDGQYLFVTSGDREEMTPAQDLSNNLGTILRLNPDGTPADGNPFADRGGVSAQIWSYGHRNPLGLEFDAEGNLWSSEMGPQGGDELNVILEGRNYGWPLASNGIHYSGAPIPDHSPGDGFEAPKVSWNPAISPGSLMVYDGDVFPEWTGDAFMGALSGQALIRVDINGAEATEGDQWDMGQRIREVEEAPDGTIWLLEDGDSGRLLQIVPD